MNTAFWSATKLLAALRAKKMSIEESRHLLRRYEEGLSGYTYLEHE